VKPTAISSLTLPVALGLAVLAAGCKGEEKAKPAPPPPPPSRPVERPQAVAPEKPPRKERTGGKVVKSVATAHGKLQIVRYGSGASAESASQSAKGKAKLVLLRFPRKDKDCPARFRVADLTRGKDPKVSDEFGNCSGRPRASAASGGWKLAFPKAGSAKARTWTYANGELREAGQKAGKEPTGYTGAQ
jgi:hypothetical protein